MLVPDYTVSAAAADGGTGKSLSIPIRLVGTVTGDLAVEPDPAARATKVALIVLRPDISANNRIKRPDGSTLELRTPEAPQPGEKVQVLGADLFAPRRSGDRGNVAALTEDGTFEVRPRIAGPGDGGAPLVRADGTLLGMVYTSSAEASTSPTLAHVFA